MKRQATGSSYAEAEATSKGIDRTQTLCPTCGTTVETMRDYCPKCERCLRPDSGKNVEDAYSGLTNRNFAVRMGRLSDMCADRDDMEGAFERE